MTVRYVDPGETVCVWDVPTWIARCNRCRWTTAPLSDSGTAVRLGREHAEHCPGRPAPPPPPPEATLPPTPRARAARQHGPMLEAECVRMICTDGAAAAAEHFGVTYDTARRWARRWRVPCSPPPLSPTAVAVGVRAIIQQFTPTKETTHAST